MHTEIRMHGASYRFWSDLTWRTGIGSPGSLAYVTEHPSEHRREFLVVPVTARRDPGPGAIPVVFEMPQSRSFVPRRRRPRFRADQPPYIRVDAEDPEHPIATFHPAKGRPRPIDRVVIVGTAAYETRGASTPRLDFTVDDLRDGPWSRTIGGFGGDREALERLQAARVTLVGCGRNGALCATHLAASGVRRIRLIDDDQVEESNVAAMGLDRGWVAARKVDAVEALIRRINLEADVQKIDEPASSPRAIRAMATADVVICAVDHGEGRLVAAAAGAAYLRPVLDVGSGITVDAVGRWHAGVDVRLCLPGHCTLCFGGVRDLDTSREINWWEQRAGSLRSVNSMGTGAAHALLERFFRTPGAIDSTWVRIEMWADGGVTSRTLHNTARGADCPVCARAGHGHRVFFGSGR